MYKYILEANNKGILLHVLMGVFPKKCVEVDQSVISVLLRIPKVKYH